MGDNTPKNSDGTFSKKRLQTKNLTETSDLNEIESQSKLLIQEILTALNELKTINRQLLNINNITPVTPAGIVSNDYLANGIYELQDHLQVIEQQKYSIIERINLICQDLESAKEILIQFKQAAEGNAHKLANQDINDFAIEMQLKRAAELAWIEAERLGQLIEKIDHFLDQTIKAMEGSNGHFGPPPFLDNNLHFAEGQPDLPDIDSILAGLNNIRSTPTNIQKFDSSRPLIGRQITPLPGLAASHGLENSLAKIPSCSPLGTESEIPESKSIQGDGLTSNDQKIRYDPYAHMRGENIPDANFDDSIIEQAGFDGSYDSYKRS